MIFQCRIFEILLSLAVIFICSCNTNSRGEKTSSGEIYRMRHDVQSRWASFENPSASKGGAGTENRGAKGHAFDNIEPGETKQLLDTTGPGFIHRIWMTMNPKTPEMLRSLRIDMYWDDAKTPAVSAPLGDFFCHIVGRGKPVDNELFSNPNGHAFNCFIPMPFRTAAKITVTNESDTYVVQFYYDVDFSLTGSHDKDVLYFHAHWRRERWTTLGEDFEVLPLIEGSGRFLGAHVGVITNPENIGWWGEGGVKVYLDGDTSNPTLMGTGTEDYMGAAWGMPVFGSRYQGCPVVDSEHGVYGFYRYHVPDPIFFHEDCRVTIQQIGCTHRDIAAKLVEKGVPFKPHSLFFVGERKSEFVRLLDIDPVPDLDEIEIPADYNSEYIFYYREDDWSAVAFFYLDRPENNLPKIAGRQERIAGIKGNVKSE